MKRIFDVLGHQDERDLSFLTEDSAVTYAQSLVKRDKKSAFKERFPKTSKPLLKLLHKLLEVNPHFRPTAKECLQDPFFDSVRNPSVEVDATCTIQQSVYMPGIFDYEASEHA